MFLKRKFKPKIKRRLWIWGPFQWLKQNKHSCPFEKTRRGKERRDERRFKLRQREEIVK